MENEELYSNSLGGFWRATGCDTGQVKSGIETFMQRYDSNAKLIEDQSDSVHNSYMKYKTSNKAVLTFSWGISLKILGSGEDSIVEKEYKSLRSFLK